MNIWETLILFAAFQAVIFAVLFSLKRGITKTANRIFALFLLLFAYDLFYCVLYWSRFDESLFVRLVYTYSLPVSLYGGIFYLYIRTLTTQQRLHWKDVFHLSPLLLVFYQFGAFYLLPANIKLEALQSGTTQAYINPFPWGHFALGCCMLIYALVGYRKFIRNYKEDPELALWLRTISTAFIIFACSHMVYAILFQLYVIPFEYDYFIVFLMILFIGMVTYFAFYYAHIFNGGALDKIIPFVKYEKTGLPIDFSLELKRKLLDIMKKEKPYLDPELRLDTVADLLDISRHHASQIINQHFAVHFYDFINEYRIKEAEHLLSDPKSSLSVTDIAFQSGFNNRISFYKAFKKIMGITPSQFRDHSMAS